MADTSKCARKGCGHTEANHYTTPPRACDDGHMNTACSCKGFLASPEQEAPQAPSDTLHCAACGWELTPAPIDGWLWCDAILCPCYQLVVREPESCGNCATLTAERDSQQRVAIKAMAEANDLTAELSRTRAAIAELREAAQKTLAAHRRGEYFLGIELDNLAALLKRTPSPSPTGTDG